MFEKFTKKNQKNQKRGFEKKNGKNKFDR